MALAGLDHVNLRTPDKEPLVRFYRDVLGMTVGPRPNQARDGAWMYAGERPLIHISVRDGRPLEGDSQIDHFAFAATELAGVLARLRENEVAYQCFVISGSGVRQVFCRDPDGNTVEMDFPAHEEADLADYPPGAKVR